jgi:hypothetical protein
LEERDKLLNFGLVPDVEFGYINLYGREIINTVKGRKTAGKNDP